MFGKMCAKTLLVAAFIFSGNLAFAEKRDDFKVNGSWFAGRVSGHYVTGKSGCMAYTVVDRKSVRLELYSQLSRSGPEFLEPFIQVTTNKYPEFLSGELDFDRGRRVFPLQLATYPGSESAIRGAMVRFSDRAEVLRLLRNRQNVSIKFFGKRRRVLKRVRISTRDFDGVYQSMKEKCQVPEAR